LSSEAPLRLRAGCDGPRTWLLIAPSGSDQQPSFRAEPINVSGAAAVAAPIPALQCVLGDTDKCPLR